MEFFRKHYGGSIVLADEAAREAADRSLGPGGRYQLVDRHLKKTSRPHQTAVELGCGNAQSLFALCERHSLTDVTGIDVAFREDTSADPVTLRNVNLNETWPFEDASSDCLIAMMVFEHLFDPFHSFGEVKRTLAPGGAAHVNLPLVTELKNRARLLAGLVQVTSVPVDAWFAKNGWDGNHLHYFSLAVIRRLAAHRGLRVSEVAGVGRMAGLKTRFPELLAAEVSFVLVRDTNAG